MLEDAKGINCQAVTTGGSEGMVCDLKEWTGVASFDPYT
jgi:hypothetical protein